MVSNVLEMDQAELIKRLKSFRRKYANDVEYKKLRASLPKDWPL